MRKTDTDKTLYKEYIYISGVGRCQKVCVCVGGGGGGGANRHVIYVPSVKNQYKRVVIGYMVIYRLCQFIEIVHKIINWYIKNA